MHYCGMSERAALFGIPYARGLQYIHAALLAQGAHCVRPGEMADKLHAISERHSELVKQYADGH